MDLETRLELVTRNTEEIITLDEVRSILEVIEHPVSYWGVTPTGPPHIGYYRGINKMQDLLKAGFKHKILLANLHAYLDNTKCPWDEMSARSQVYQKCFELLGLENAEFIYGSDIEETAEYQRELLRASPFVTVSRAKHAASEVTRSTNAKVSELIYPIMQSLDSWTLDADIVLGGMDQRHIWTLTRELLPKLDHKKPAVVLHPLGMGLTGAKKMDASRSVGRLTFFDSEEEIHNKIGKTYCPAQEIDGNPIIDYVAYFVFPQLKCDFTVERKRKYGGDLSYSNIDDLINDFENGELHPQDLKIATASHLIDILRPIRNYFSAHSSLLDTFNKSFISAQETTSSTEMAKKYNLKSVISTQPLLELDATQTGIANVNLEGGSGVYFGTGLCSHKEMSKGVPIDALSMILTAASLRNKMRFQNVYHNLADSHAKSNKFPIAEIENTVSHYEQVIGAVTSALGIKNYNIIRATVFQEDQKYHEILKRINEHSELSQLHIYARQEIADIEYFRQKGANLKVGWTMSIPNSQYDESFYDRNYRKHMNCKVAFVYVVPGRSFHPTKPRAAPYVDFDPAHRILLSDKNATQKLEVAYKELGKKLHGAEKYYQGLFTLWKEFDPNLPGGSTTNKMNYILDKVNKNL